MSAPRFIGGISWSEIPKEPRGRYTRISFDIDADAVHDFILHDRDGSVEPWPVAVIEELSETLLEWAMRENMTLSMLERRQ